MTRDELLHAAKKLVGGRGTVLEKECMCSPAVVLVTWSDGSGRSSMHEVCYTLKELELVLKLT